MIELESRLSLAATRTDDEFLVSAESHNHNHRSPWVGVKGHPERSHVRAKSPAKPMPRVSKISKPPVGVLDTYYDSH